MYRHFPVYRIFHLRDRTTRGSNVYLVSTASSQHAPAEFNTRGELHERPITSSKLMTISESTSCGNQVDSLPIVFAQGHILIQFETRPSPPGKTENNRENRESEIRFPPYQETQTSKKGAHVGDRILSPVSKPRDARERWGYESRAEGDGVQVGDGAEKYATSYGKSPEGKAENQDENARELLDCL